MEFKKYNSIENTYQKAIIDKIFIQGFDKETYIVQEKVHGSNFSFYTDGKIVKIAKRTDFITEDEVFNNAHQVADKYREKVINLFNLMQATIENVSNIIIYGELFGGNYAHKAVKKIEGAARIQKGIDYCPDNDFYAFDIKINSTYYLSVKEANDWFEKTGFFYAKTLFEGSLADALKYPNDFDSLIPYWLGLPALEKNTIEGTIIRPNEVKYFGNGSRVILKNKNEKWTEKSAKKEREPQKAITFSEEAQEVWSEIQTYINENRLDNVLSKIGAFEPKLMGKITGLFAQDVIADFLKDNQKGFNLLEKDEQKSINKLINNQIIQLIKEKYYLV